MHATKEILDVWERFDEFPMETLTKAWFNEKGTDKKQREVFLMKEHYNQFGITGNCFDLSIWLLDAFVEAGIKAYPVGSHLHTKNAHVAVIALNEKGKRYLCDLGDQWIQPVLLDKDCSDFTEDSLHGFFPGADVSVKAENDRALIQYYRPNGKVSEQMYNLTRIEMNEFLSAAEHSQRHIKNEPLLECRINEEDEVVHWEFYNWQSMKSTNKGLFHDQKLDTVAQWVKRIHDKTGYDEVFLFESLQLYANNK